MQKIFINSIISNLGISSDTISQHQAKQGELLQELIKSYPDKKMTLYRPIAKSLKYNMST